MAAELVQALSPLQSVHGLLSLVGKAVRARWQYRFAILMSVVVNALGFSVFFLVWGAVYKAQPDAPGLSQSELFGYLAIAFILNFTFDIHLERRFEDRMRQGLIVADLLRPIGLMTTQMGHSVADVITNSILAVPLCGVAYLLFADAVLPHDQAYAALGLVSAGLGLAVAVGIRYVVVQFAFVLDSAHGVNFGRMALHQAFSGMTAPLTLFPEALRTIAAFLPFRQVLETPALIWLGRVPMGAVPGLLWAQLAWAAALFAGSGLIYRSVLHRHQSQGG